MTPRQFSSKKEIVLVLIVLVLSIVGWQVYQQWTAPSADSSIYAEISQKGQLVYTLSLSDNQSVSMPLTPAVQLEVKGGKVAFIHSDCPDRVCIGSGWLSRPGQSAACLPNGVILTLTSEDPAAHGGVDLVA